MKTRHYIIAMMSVVTLTANAQTYTPNSANNGAVYDGTVYEPFSNTTPSEQTEVGASYSPAKAPSGRRELGGGTDVGNQDEGYPVGDAMVPLMVMAVVMGAVIAFRRRRAMKVTRK